LLIFVEKMLVAVCSSADVLCHVLAVGATVLLSRGLVTAACASGVTVRAAIPSHAPVAAPCAENDAVVVGAQAGADLVS